MNAFFRPVQTPAAPETECGSADPTANALVDALDRADQQLRATETRLRPLASLAIIGGLSLALWLPLIALLA